MNSDAHLILRQMVVNPSMDWREAGGPLGFYCVQNGLGYLMSEKETREIAEGDVIIAAGTKGITLRASILTSLRIVYFYINHEYLGFLLNGRELRILDRLVKNAPSWVKLVRSNQPEAADFRALASTSEAKNDFGTRIKLLDQVAQLLDEQWRQAEPPRADDPNQRFEAVTDELTNSDILSLSSAEIAKRCGWSERHFSRMFREKYGRSLREKVLSIRLEIAKTLLRSSKDKIIDIALASGFQNLSFFNAVFKRAYGITPSQWRDGVRGHAIKPKKRSTKPAIALFFWLAAGVAWVNGQVPSPVLAPPGALNSANTNTAPTPRPVNSTNVTFKVAGYEVAGNTLLTPKEIDRTLAEFAGDAVTIEQVKNAKAALATLYRRKGYATIAVSVPPQKSTNHMVRLEVVESKLAEIQIVGNRYYSSNNIMRMLPSLKTNILINSQWFSPELDLANTDPDCQVYPEILPGPEPGTSALVLKVKDKLPLHGRFDVNNQSTPGTPDLRMNASLSYNNLWQLGHAVGLQYGFSPEDFKIEDQLPAKFYDEPLIANYSGYYRLPLGKPASMQEQMKQNPNDFGYDEATRQFRMPPTTGRPEATIYASRSTVDTGVKYGERLVVTQTATTTLSSQDSGRDLTENENLGFRTTWPVRVIKKVASSVSFGLDYKAYRATSYNTNNFFTHSELPNPVSTNLPPIIVEDELSSAQPIRVNSVQYLPLSLHLDLSFADRWGITTFGVGASANVSGWASGKNKFQALTGSTNVSGTYGIINGDLNRTQKLPGDWSILVRLGGQWASEPLISNEQYALGGINSVRGYKEGAQYGDHGWHVMIEPRTPLIDCGLVDSRWTMRARFSVFTDYGQTYRIENASGQNPVQMWGTGCGMAITIGDAMDMRVALAWPLLDAGQTTVGRGMVHFSVGAQF